MADVTATFNSITPSMRQNAHARLGAQGSNKQAFADMLGKVQMNERSTDPNKIRDVAEKYVASAMLLPMLKQAREARDTAPPFGMTDAEKQMGSLMDARLANDMVKRGGFAIVDTITNKLVKAAEKAAGAHAVEKVQ